MGIRKRDLQDKIEYLDDEVIKLWHSNKALCEIIHEQNTLIDKIRNELAILGNQVVCVPAKRPVGRPRSKK